MLHLINWLHLFTRTNNIIIRLLSLILRLLGMSEVSLDITSDKITMFISTEAVLRSVLSSMKAVHLQK